MNNYLSLTKALIKNGSNIFGFNKPNPLKSILYTIVFIAAFSPIIVGISAFVSSAYNILEGLTQQGLVLALGLSAVSFAIFFFGIFYIINVFYFSKDIENLLPLPLRPSEILLAKLTVTIFYEYITELMFLLPILITFGIKSSYGILYYLYGVLIFLVLPIIPLVFAAVLDMVVLRFTNIAKNKDKFRIIGGIIAMFLALGINTSLQRLSNIPTDPQQLQQLIEQGNNSLLSISSKFFPSTQFGTSALIDYASLSGFANLIVFLVINILSLAIFVFMGELLYFKGVLGISEASSKRGKLTSSEIDKAVIQSSKIKAYTLKELKILFRTPIYFMNCILMNFIWPIFLAIPIMLEPEAVNDLNKLIELVQNPKTISIVLAGAFAMGAFIAASNCITSTSISREGQNIFISKYLPISYKEQLLAKFLSGMIMGIIGNSLLIMAFSMFLKLSLYLILLISIVCLIGIIFSSFTGLILDLYLPKLHWDNEQKAVKQNMNVLFNMIIATVLGGANLGLFSMINVDLWIVFGLIAIIFGAIDLLMYRFIVTKGVQLYGKIEA